MKPINYFIENTGEKYCLRVPVTLTDNETKQLIIIKDKSCKPNMDHTLIFYDEFTSPSFDSQKWTKRDYDYPIYETKDMFCSDSNSDSNSNTNKSLVIEGKVRLRSKPENMIRLLSHTCYIDFYANKDTNELHDFICVDNEDISECCLDIPDTEFKYRVIIDGTKIIYQTLDLANNVLQTDYTDVTNSMGFFKELVYHTVEYYTSFDTGKILNVLDWAIELHFDGVKHDYIYVYNGLNTDKPLDVTVTLKSNDVMVIEVSNTTDKSIEQLISIDVTDLVKSRNEGLRILNISMTD